MNVFVKKIFNLSDIRYSWLLLVSMLFFMFSLYYNKINPNISTMIELITYGGAVALAIVWSILNYIDHIKINVQFRKYDKIILMFL
jgi:NADH:ubiquinone oxidoreductase subunit 6 (subunit J)